MSISQSRMETEESTLYTQMVMSDEEHDQFRQKMIDRLAKADLKEESYERLIELDRDDILSQKVEKEELIKLMIVITRADFLFHYNLGEEEYECLDKLYGIKERKAALFYNEEESKSSMNSLGRSEANKVRDSQIDKVGRILQNDTGRRRSLSPVERSFPEPIKETVRRVAYPISNLEENQELERIPEENLSKQDDDQPPLRRFDSVHPRPTLPSPSPSSHFIVRMDPNLSSRPGPSPRLESRYNYTEFTIPLSDPYSKVHTNPFPRPQIVPNSAIFVQGPGRNFVGDDRIGYRLWDGSKAGISAKKLN